ncbi:MAG: PLP-dependent aminotransferase family protein [Pseudomonadota bacterium]
MNTIWRPILAERDGPKYKALADAIRIAIGDGALEVGQKLPPVRDLAWDLQITPGTVARAYTVLTDQGVLEAAVGRGTFVAPPAGDAPPIATPLRPIEVDVVPHGTYSDPAGWNLVSPGLPDVGQAQLIRDLMGEIAANPRSGVMHYPNAAAFRPAREAVMHWLEGTPLGALDQEDIVLTHGGQNGLCLALQSVLRGTRPVVLVEELCYPGFRRAAELLRADIAAVPLDAEGLIPEAIEALARRHDVQALLTSPEVHNPTGAFTPQHRRHQIAALAQQYDFQIIEDDCYRLGASRAPSYRMLAPDRGWYVSSISKTLTPALRIGFAIAPKPHVAALRRSAEFGFFGLATPLGDLTARLLKDPRTSYLADQIKQHFGRYVQTCVNHLGRHDLTWHVDVPYVWLRLPDGWRTSAFCQAAAARNIQIRPAEDYAGREGKTPHAVRIAINAQISLAHFEKAMIQLSELLDNPSERIGV